MNYRPGSLERMFDLLCTGLHPVEAARSAGISSGRVPRSLDLLAKRIDERPKLREMVSEALSMTPKQHRRLMVERSEVQAALGGRPGSVCTRDEYAAFLSEIVRDRQLHPRDRVFAGSCLSKLQGWESPGTLASQMVVVLGEVEKSL